MSNNDDFIHLDDDGDEEDSEASTEAPARLKRVELELRQIDAQVLQLQDRRARLTQSRDKLLQQIQADQLAPRKDWQHDRFDWDDEVERILKATFRLGAFRWGRGAVLF